MESAALARDVAVRRQRRRPLSADDRRVEDATHATDSDSLPVLQSALQERDRCFSPIKTRSQRKQGQCQLPTELRQPEQRDLSTAGATWIPITGRQDGPPLLVGAELPLIPCPRHRSEARPPAVAQPGGVKGVRSHPSLILGAHRRFELQHYAA